FLKLAPHSHAREWIKNLILRPHSQQRREISILHGLCGNSKRSVIPRPGVGDSLDSPQEERFVLSVVNLRNVDGAADRPAVTIGKRFRTGLTGPIGEEIVGREAARLAPEVGRAMQRVRAGLDADAGDAAFGVAELSVEGRGLDFEFLD